MSYGFVITEMGKNLLAKLGTGEQLKITRIMVGKGEIAEGQNPADFTDLVQPVAQATSTLPLVKENTLSFIVEYRNDLNGGLEEGFWLKEFGVFAQDGENEILLYYATLGDFPQYVQAYINGVVNIKRYPVTIAVSDKTEVVVSYNVLAFVTEERMKEFSETDTIPYLEGVLEETENKIQQKLDEKANVVHEHSADEITSGILPVERGGTGATTAADARTNLGAAASSHTHNYAGSSSAGGAATSSVKLQTARTIDGMNFDGSANIAHFGVCSTAADVAEKTVALAGFVLAEGARVAVYFSNSNTHSNPKLNVNGTGAKAISCIKGSWAPVGQWEANQIVEFVYYSSHWIMITANARRLYTARSIRTNLGSTSSANFDGTANITPGVTGTLPIANGGTGATSASAALSNLGGFSKTGGTISGNVDITGNVRLKGSGNFGNKLNFGDSDYVSISEPTDDNLEIKAREMTIKAWDRTNSCINLSAQNSVRVTNGKFMSKSIMSDSNNDMFLNGGENIIIGTRNLIGYTINDSFVSTASGRIFTLQDNPTYLSSYKAGDKLYFFNLVGSQSYETYIVESIDGNKVTVTKDIVGLSSERGYQGHVCFDRLVGINSGIYGNAVLGYNNINIASNSFVFGDSNRSIGSNSFVFGDHLSNKYRDTFLVGKYNNIASGNFIIGKGTSGKSTANCFRVTDTAVYATGNYNSTGADYAEYFQWKDNNPNKEDRRGLFVSLDGDKIQLADSKDNFILGIISGNPSVIGDSCEDQWNHMFECDIYGTPIMEEVEIPERKELKEVIKEPIYDENGNEIEQEKEYQEIIVEETHTEIRQKLNPEYDPTQEYIPRSERPEWAVVGMMGKLVVIDDGSCEENGWCTAGEGGIAVKSETQTKFRVMKRLDKKHIKVLVL